MFRNWSFQSEAGAEFKDGSGSTQNGKINLNSANLKIFKIFSFCNILKVSAEQNCYELRLVLRQLRIYRKKSKCHFYPWAEADRKPTSSPAPLESKVIFLRCIERSRSRPEPSFNWRVDLLRILPELLNWGVSFTTWNCWIRRWPKKARLHNFCLCPTMLWSRRREKKGRLRLQLWPVFKEKNKLIFNNNVK